MSLSLSAYKVRASSTAGIMDIISPGATPSITSSLSASSEGLIIKASTGKVAIFTGNTQLGSFNNSSPEFSVTGYVHATDGYKIGNNLGVTVASAAGFAMMATVSAGIITYAQNVSISSGTNYWVKTGNSLSGINGETIYGTGLSAEDFISVSQGIGYKNFHYKAQTGLLHIISDAGYDIMKLDPTFEIVGTEEIFALTGGAQISGNLNVAGSKNFKIPHPNPEKTKTHYLVYSSLEGPETGIYFRKIFDLDKNEITILLPDYWKWLVDKETIQVICDAPEYLYRIVDNEKIKFTRSNTSKDKILSVSMFVIAERKLLKGEKFETEPIKKISKKNKR